MKDYANDVKTLCEIRIKLTKNKTTEPWTMEDLLIVLKQLEKDKARDPEGYANEIFKEEVAGKDLLQALLKNNESHTN